ncbi:uncharacterized protein [Onthophagus taurus]|uniref:uncharacterized protein n=1 Tax=Onthophagus taurus TaxID=166361 RepID=UPI0039BEAD74
MDIVCKPIDTLEELFETIKNPPQWINRINQLTQPPPFVIKNTFYDCHVSENDYEPKTRITRNETPKTLICHDMKGGYLCDKFIDGCHEGNGFTFHRWAQTDIFCYFSHHFVTIPPLQWINLAHKNGTLVLGTIITEHEKGKEICKKIFNDFEVAKKFADALIEVCVIYKFDGWLLNFENQISCPKILLQFVEYLSFKIHREIPSSQIIWYDSVLYNGKLSWQNELNENNRCFFDCCDGIFLNYFWNEEKIAKTQIQAGDRRFDVYVGIDIWGRGTYGGGQFQAYKAADIIQQFGLSTAIFAHGWVHEKTIEIPEHDFLNRYYSRDSLFWKLLWPYLYTKPIQQPFTTFFKTGVNSNCYDLNSQQIQPTYFPAHALTIETMHLTVAREVCRCVQERLISDERMLLISSHHLHEKNVIHRLFSMNLKLKINTVIDIYTYRVEDHFTDFAIVLLMVDEENKKVKCVANSKTITTFERKISRISNIIKPEIYYKNKDEEFDENRQEDRNENRTNEGVKQYDRRRFVFTYPEHELLEVGIKLLDGSYLYLSGFSIQTN